jgi:hypothetical protein
MLFLSGISVAAVYKYEFNQSGIKDAKKETQAVRGKEGF